MGIPIYAPVSGYAVSIDGGLNIAIFWEGEVSRNDIEEGRNVIVRREVLLIHLDPNTTVQIPITGKQVRRGDLIGNLCRHMDRNRCNIQPSSRDDIEFAVNHLAVQVRFSNYLSQVYAPLDSEVLGVLAIPSCIFDNWVENHLVRTPKDPETATWLVNWFAACPSN